MDRPRVSAQKSPDQHGLPFAGCETQPIAGPQTVAAWAAEPRAVHVSGYEREGRDFYATPSWVTEALLRHVRFRGSVWEPCCGDGAMSSVLVAHGYTVTSTDIAERGFGTSGIDFLTCRTMPEGAWFKDGLQLEPS